MIDPYPFGAALFRAGFRVLGVRPRSFGHEHVPRVGPAVLASNHVGYLDFCFVALTPPHPRRRVRFVARHEVFAHPVAGPLMRSLRQIEADPYGDPHLALRQAKERLVDGEVVGIHPEGTISPSFEPREGRSGAVRMAQAAGAPIVPVAVWGSHRLLTKWRPRNLRTRGIVVDVHYGEPYHPVGDPGEATQDLTARIRALLEHAWDVYPQQPVAGDEWWVPACRGGTAPTPDEAERRIREQHQRRRRARGRNVA